MPTAPTSGKQNIKRAKDQKAGKESKPSSEKKSAAPMKKKKK